MKNKKTIGILGGMGPLATVNLYYEIIKIAQNKYHAVQDYDYPPMIIYNLPITGFDETGFKKPQLVKEQLLAGAKTLEKAGCDFIVIGCNTMYYFYHYLQSKLKISVINIVKETSKKVEEEKYQKIGILSSESTKRLKLYENELKKPGILSIQVSNYQQEKINHVVLNVMSGKHNQGDLEIIKSIIQDLCKKGAEAIIIACTELPLVISQKDISIKLFNTTEIIAETALKQAYI